MGAGGEPHHADMAGDTGGDLRGAHVGDRRQRFGDPVGRHGIVHGCRRIFDQDHDRKPMLGPLDILEPGSVRDCADADLAGIHEIGTALDVLGAPAKVVGDGRLGGGGVAVGESGEDLAVAFRRAAERCAGDHMGRRPPRRAGRFLVLDRYVAWQRLERERPEMKRPVLRTRIEKHDTLDVVRVGFACIMLTHGADSVAGFLRIAHKLSRNVFFPVRSRARFFAGSSR